MLRGGVDLATGVIFKVTLYSFLYLYLEIQLPHIYIYRVLHMFFKLTYVLIYVYFVCLVVVLYL